MLDDVGSSYAPPISSISLDQNIIAVMVYPTKIGEKALIENDAGYQVDGDIVTTLEPSSVKLDWEGIRIKATGSIKMSDQPLTLKISPRELKAYILQKMKPILKDLKLKNKAVFLKEIFKTDLNKQLFASVVSEPLDKIIPPALKKSDNSVFDCLYLKLIHDQEPLTIKDWQDGDKVIKALIKKHFHVNMEKALVVDGSGLSRYNRIQPRQLFEILKQGYSTKEFVAALATPGETKSTLEKRKILLTGIKTKTGNMSGISCLCGYRIKDKDTKAFVMIANSFSPPSSEIFPVLDDFLVHYLK
jgi:D-alanyl-D-alanine carboxypeptidase/D-alanyl-D-alanine-endopeptidase (penicillin-binding protein 4)